MGDVTKDDVQRAVQDGLRDLKDNLQRIRDNVQKIEQRTNDLDNSQQEIQRIRFDTADMKLRVQNIERGILQITQYLQAKNDVTGDQAGDGGWKS